MSAHNPGKAADRRVTEAKKPFDWMTDDQFHNLQLLAQNYEWFMEMFERLANHFLLTTTLDLVLGHIFLTQSVLIKSHFNGTLLLNQRYVFLVSLWNCKNKFCFQNWFKLEN